MRWFIGLLLVWFSFACVSTQERPCEVAFCDLMATPARYDGRVVRTTAELRVGDEQSELRDPRCPSPNDAAWWEPKGWRNPESNVARALDAIVREQGFAHVRVVGKFHGPRKYEPAPGLSPEMAERIRRANSRYGHLNMYRTMFEVTMLESATK